MRTLACGILLGLLTGVTPAGEEPSDPVRSAWRYRRTVEVGPQDQVLAALAVPPEVLAKSATDLRDLRIVDGDGRDQPMTIKRLEPRTATVSWTGRLMDARSEKGRASTWVVDLGSDQIFDTVSLDIAEKDFAKGIKLEASKDSEKWQTVREDVGVFDRQWTVRVHHTDIALTKPVSARFLRLTADDRRSPPVPVQGVSVSRARDLPGDRWEMRAPLRPLQRADRRSAWSIDLPPGLPFDEIQISSTTPVFSRTALVNEDTEANGRHTVRTIGRGQIYRLSLGEALISGEQRSLRTTPSVGSLVLEIEDGDSPPLDNVSAVVSGPTVRLVFPKTQGRLFLYYGNPLTRGPIYDLAALQSRIDATDVFAGTELGPEVENPRFRPAPPLAFAAKRGASIDPGQWSHRRSLDLQKGEDIFTTVLGVEDLALLRPDLADLRVVDSQDRQIPYILEPRATFERVPLHVETTPFEVNGAHWTRHRLKALSTDNRALKISLESLELQFAETFFSRPARLSVPEGPAGETRVILSTILARNAGGGDRIVLNVGGPPSSEWILEIDEGDNAPLGAPTAAGVVGVPRAVFKAGPGTYALLLGDDQAQAPRYDIASLREEVLAYSATVVTPGPLTANPRFRRHIGAYFSEEPSIIGLWVAVLGGVVVLLVLTGRILGSPPRPS